MESAKRQIAVKTNIAHALAQLSPLTQEQIAQSGFGRVNIIATIVAKGEGQYPTLTLDDGSGELTARTFDQPQLITNAPLGEIVTVIGRPRKYGDGVYLIPEIIRPVTDRRWVEVRLRELGRAEQRTPQPSAAAEPPSSEGPIERTLSAIRQLDHGEGAAIEELVRRLPGAEPCIEQLLLRGEIFQLTPGKVKVLE